ncbi:MAG: pentapeptide repeat-containing protein [bacterium]
MSLKNEMWEVLKTQGAEAFNRMRKEEPGFRPNFSGYDFRGLEIEGIDLSFANLTEANFREMTIHKADFSHASMSHANLSFSVLCDTRFDAVKSECIEIMNSKVFNCIFDQAKMVEANMARTIFVGGHFYGVNLLKSYLTDSEYCLQGEHGGAMTDCNLRGAELSNAVFRGLLMGGTDFRGATMRGTDLRLANLRGCIFKDREVSRAKLKGAHITVQTTNGFTEARILEVLPLSCSDISEIIPSSASEGHEFFVTWQDLIVNIRTLPTEPGWDPFDINYLNL